MWNLKQIKKMNFEHACNVLAEKYLKKEYRDLTDKQCAEISKEVAKLRRKLI